ncbi:hypothetical protein ALC60_06783 [Trachymyrmex zeteki]|uniref:Uncharacterized protein n=1 Tax=Mycetomoellerius zeteki TaxID=64791 RepID=A0A151X1F7_9HYME|nr:hypothetical protein ALC60_06783 [Trachymyrmex zeteki]
MAVVQGAITSAHGHRKFHKGSGGVQCRSLGWRGFFGRNGTERGERERERENS